MVKNKTWKISEICIDKINKMMKTLSSNDRIFQSEAQFQLELAMLIKEESGLNIIVEFATLRDIEAQEDKIKKDYTDIIIYDDKGNYIALELKYKTRYMWIEDEKFLLREHGASDLGRYDFLHDVVRLQRLKDTNNLPKKLKKYVNGFAVFLTNESRYWNEKFSRRKTVKYNYSKFCFSEADKLIKDEKLEWGNKSSANDTWRRDAIILNKTYDIKNEYKWQDYIKIEAAKKVNDICVKETFVFKYLVLDV